MNKSLIDPTAPLMSNGSALLLIGSTCVFTLGLLLIGVKLEIPDATFAIPMPLVTLIVGLAGVVVTYLFATYHTKRWVYQQLGESS